MSGYLPPDAGLINLATLGVVANDPSAAAANDTALRNAFSSFIKANSRYPNPKQMLLPPGDWHFTNITSRIVTGGHSGLYSDGWYSSFQLIGQSAEETRIILPANTAEYGDRANPKALIVTGSENDGESPGNYSANPTGSGNEAFRHYLRDLTIVIKAGNPGAIALDLCINNRGGIENIQIIDEGNTAYAGIALWRKPGPSYAKNVLIKGFDYGVLQAGSLTNLAASAADYAQSFSGLTLIGQRTTGCYANGLPIAFENLVSYNTVPVLDLQGVNAVTTVSGGHFYGIDRYSEGAIVATKTPKTAANPAIKNRGNLHLKHLKNEAYDVTLLNQSSSPNTTLKGDIVRYASSILNPLFEGTPGYFDLEIKPSPVVYSTTPSDYVNARSFMQTGEASHVWVQRAIDNATERILYFPNASHGLASTVFLRGRQEKIVGYCANFGGTAATSFQFEDRIDGLDKPLVLEDIRFNGLVHNSKRALSIRRCDSIKPHSISVGESGIFGKTFIEDCIACVIFNRPHHLWARQLNTEFYSVLLQITGGTAWILDTKHECNSSGSRVDISAGAKVEILNAHTIPLSAINGAPLFRIRDSEVQLTYRVSGNGSIKVHIKETRFGVVREYSGVPRYAMFRSRF